ncbi:MAG: hypothetical protein HY554_17610 [Elusimicrobia bacterium]|nr:hypothetical protein [Elusimicrobiota bacterium]
MTAGWAALWLAAAAAANPALATAAPSGAGVIVMAHGGDRAWDEAVRAATAPLARRVAVELAFGMADPESLERAAAALEARGVRRIAVVRLFVSGESFRERTRKILGLSPGAGPRPEGLDSKARGHHGHGGGPAFHDPDTMPLWRIRSASRFALCPDGLLDSALPGRILAERARALSKEPAAESVLVLAHGPGDEAENRRWLEALDRLAAQVRRAAPFRAVKVETLREDWPERRKEAEGRIRAFVAEGSRDGRVLVLPFRVHGFGPYADVLQGLDYVSDGKGLLPHPLIGDWLAERAAATFRQAGWLP